MKKGGIFIILKRFPTDEELLKRIKDGDEMAENVFLEKYRVNSTSLVFDYIAKYPVYRFICDDLQSIVFCNTIKVLKNYSCDKGVFYPYWKKISLRCIDKYLQAHKYFADYLNNMVSLDKIVKEGQKSLHDVIGKEDKTVNENLLSENLMKIAKDPINKLSVKEQVVIELFLDGFDFKEIARLSGWSLSGIYKFYKSAVKKIGIVLKDPKR